MSSKRSLEASNMLRAWLTFAVLVAGVILSGNAVHAGATGVKDKPGHPRFVDTQRAELILVFPEDMSQEERWGWETVVDEAVLLLTTPLVEQLDGITVLLTEHHSDCDAHGCAFSSERTVALRIDRFDLSQAADVDNGDPPYPRIDAVATVIHEFAHLLYWTTGSAEWFGAATEESPLPTGYSYKNVRERFAESVMVYVMWPSAMAECCEELYNVLRDNVFGGFAYTFDYPITGWIEREFSRAAERTTDDK